MKNVMTKTFNLHSLFKVVIFSAFFLGCTTSAVFACTCGAPPTSGIGILSSSRDIIIGKVTSHQISSNTIEVEVQRVLKGNYASQKIRILGGDAQNCFRVYLSRFPVNTTWVFALSLLPAGASSEASHFVSICAPDGVNAFQVKAGKVYGRLHFTNQNTSMPLPRFIKSLRR